MTIHDIDIACWEETDNIRHTQNRGDGAVDRTWKHSLCNVNVLGTYRVARFQNQFEHLRMISWEFFHVNSWFYSV